MAILHVGTPVYGIIAFPLAILHVGIRPFSNPACGDPIWLFKPKSSCMWGLVPLAILHVGIPARGIPAFPLIILHMGTHPFINPARGDSCAWYFCIWSFKTRIPFSDDFSIRFEYNLNKKSILFGTLQFSRKNIICQQHSCIPFRNPACGHSCYMAILHVGTPVCGIPAYGAFKRWIPCV